MDKAWNWLRENDPEFDKRNNIEYPYLSKEQLRRRRSKREIPISSLGNPTIRKNIGITDIDARQLLRITN